MPKKTRPMSSSKDEIMSNQVTVTRTQCGSNVSSWNKRQCSPTPRARVSMPASHAHTSSQHAPICLSFRARHQTSAPRKRATAYEVRAARGVLWLCPSLFCRTRGTRIKRAMEEEAVHLVTETVRCLFWHFQDVHTAPAKRLGTLLV